MNNRAFVLDANILIRAVLGKRVRDLIFKHADHIDFFAPDAAYAEAKKYLPNLQAKRRIPHLAAMLVLSEIEAIVQSVDTEMYLEMKAIADTRIAKRDANDWPVLACAMKLGCTIWTEDQDFFGTGVATWTTDRVELYFA